MNVFMIISAKELNGILDIYHLEIPEFGDAMRKNSEEFVPTCRDTLNLIYFALIEKVDKSLVLIQTEKLIENHNLPLSISENGFQVHDAPVEELSEALSLLLKGYVLTLGIPESFFSQTIEKDITETSDSDCSKKRCRCPKCGASCDYGESKCEECGLELHYERGKVVVHLCTNCGAYVNKTGEVCTVCGKEIRKTQNYTLGE